MSVESWIIELRHELDKASNLQEVIYKSYPADKDLGEALLRFNTGNRPPNLSKAREFTRAMEATPCRWYENAMNPIYLSKSGELHGQTRAMALKGCRDNIVVPVTIAFWVDDNVRYFVDNATPWIAKHTMKLLGAGDSKATGTVVQTVASVRAKQRLPSNTLDVKELYQGDKSRFDQAVHYSKANKIAGTSQSAQGVFSYFVLYHSRFSGRLEEFLSKVSSGQGDAVIGALYNKFINGKGANRDFATRAKHVAWMIRTWNIWAPGHSRRRSPVALYNPIDLNKEDFPLPL